MIIGLEDDVVKAKNEKMFEEQSELRQVMEQLDSDQIDPSTLMSNIDFNTRIDRTEMKNILVIDELTRLGILPKVIGLTRQHKRLAVSIGGEGRKEKVRIVASERESRAGTGFVDGVKNMFRKH